MSEQESSISERVEAEYERVNENIRVLMDVRFKLLAFLPVFGGVAVFLLSGLGVSGAGSGSLAPPAVVAAVSLLAFVATLGVVAYDQRNSELYNALIHRAKYLESLFAAPVSPGTIRETKTGGQFNERPRPQKELLGFIKAKHDVGLALVYGPMLGAWVFPFILGIFGSIPVTGLRYTLLATAAAVLSGLALTRHLIRLDEDDSKRWNEASRRSS